MNDIFFMKRALRLAGKGAGLVSPNPLVGAVVTREGRVVGEGFHRFFGGPHAEIEALSRAGSAAGGATLYVTLEPCCHHGKTPPCAEAVINAGIRRTVVAMADPNPLVAGKGLARLARAGLQVESGLLEAEAREKNCPYLVNISRQRPFILIKSAQSIDGRIAGPGGCSKWLTSEKSRLIARRMRFEFDALMVGISTVLADDPGLDFQAPAGFSKELAGRKRYFKVIMDSRARLPADARLWKGTGTVVVAVSASAPRERVAALERRGARVMVSGEKRPEIRKVLESLYEMQAGSLMVEGGGEVIASFFEAGLPDRFIVFQAPLVMGGESLPSIAGPGWTGPGEAPRFRLHSLRRVGDDCLLDYRPGAEERPG